VSIHLHLLGGAGRIGSALVDSLLADPLEDLSSIYVYCDSTKALHIKTSNSPEGHPHLYAVGYSSFAISPLYCNGLASPDDAQIVVNLRGVNTKKLWLNQPLDALELQTKSCKLLVDSDLWMHRRVSIIHLSSQLCDLIESPMPLNEICEGQESYRRPYMVSRLHQEAMLSAYAYKYATPTIFVRLPAVYGFSDDSKSPWVLNAFVKQKRKNQTAIPRNPQGLVNLTHRIPLISFLRSIIVRNEILHDSLTVRYLRPPMLQMSVQALSSLVNTHGEAGISSTAMESDIALLEDSQNNIYARSNHLQLLKSAIDELLNHE